MAPRSAHVRPLPEVAVEVAQDCLQRLDSAAALTDEVKVHELRIATKRLRAAWRLVSGQVGKTRAADRRHALSALAAKLSGARDLTVLARLAQRLSAAQTDDRIAKALAQVVTALERRYAAAETPAQAPAGMLKEIRMALAEEIADWQALARDHRPLRRREARRELHRSRRRARREAREADHTLDPELWHDWRKTVKRLHYQREWVALAEGRPVGKFDRRLRRLGNRLGKRNDLANLTGLAEALVAAGELAAADHDLVCNAIGTVESRLIDRCRRLGKRTFRKIGKTS